MFYPLLNLTREMANSLVIFSHELPHKNSIIYSKCTNSSFINNILCWLRHYALPSRVKLLTDCLNIKCSPSYSKITK